MKMISSLAALLLGISSLFGASYNVDVAHTNVAFKVKHMMVSTVGGEFQNFSGTFELDDKSALLTKLQGEIDVDSINTNIEDRDAHLKSSEIFDAEKYPKIKFVLDKVKGDKAYGKLTIKDVTKDVVLDYEFGGTITDPMGKKRAGFTLAGTIDRRDYNVKWNRVLEAGGVAVSEKVKLDISVEGIAAK
ncbi:MAG: YceI family protein [Sulfurimonas sp.]|nr:YceI family protein [Sulfurimonas sp.]